jgi:hypothetical protein
MKKKILALALWLLASSAAAQQGFYCGNTGFTNNTGAPTSSFRCAPQFVRRGAGTIVLNATATATNALGGFVDLVAPDALPGAGGVFFKTSGVIVRLNGFTYFYRLTAKASSTSITISAGAAAPGESGSSSDWSYWNTTCYRSSSIPAATTDANVGSQRLWAKLGSDQGSPQPMGLFVYALATSAASQTGIYGLRPQGMTAPTPVDDGAAGFITDARTYVYAEVGVAAQLPATGVFIGEDVQLAQTSAATDTYYAVCMVRLVP